MFVSIDGPKGSGKTTLLHRLAEAFPPSLSVEVHTEKTLDPYRELTESLLKRYAAGTITSDVEKEIVKLLAAGRARISGSELSKTDVDVILMDRWYPSDAYFRHVVPFDEVLATNIEHGVTRPDLVLAAVCDPYESWRRANARPQGLDSKAGLTIDQHVEASRAFERAIDKYGFTRLSTDATLDVVASRARDIIMSAIQSSKPSLGFRA